MTDRVATQQRRNRLNYARRRGVKQPDLLPGDLVRVRRPGHVPKHQSRFSAPVAIAQQLGPATFLLADGTKRNAAHLACVPRSGHTGTGPATPPEIPVGTTGTTPPPLQPQTTPDRSPTPTPDWSATPTPDRSPAPDGTARAAADTERTEHELQPSSFGRRRFLPVKLR